MARKVTMPAETKKKRRLGTADRILLALSLVLIFGAAAMIGYASLMNWTPLAETGPRPGPDGTITSGPVSLDPDMNTSADIKEKIVHFLVVGTDYTETDLKAGTGRANLSDVIMVVSLNKEDGSVNVLNIPRDTFIGTEYPTGKINAVYNNKEKGGIENLARVIYDRFRIPIDHYVTINMDGFISLVDAIGGVEIVVEQGFTLEGVTINPGKQTLTGLQAEKFVRERHSRSGGDIGRIQAQRSFLAALFKKCKNLSVSELTALAPIAFQEISTDLTVKQMLEIGLKVLKLDSDKISFHLVPGEACYANGFSVWSVHKDELAAILNDYFRPFSDPIPAEDLNVIEVQHTIDHFDDMSTNAGELLGDE